MKIYTKTGDDGTTGLYGGDRVSKNSRRIHAIGEVDELNASIGLARLYAKDDPLDTLLEKIQSWLFDLGAELASPAGGKFDVKLIRTQHIAELEESIDAQTEVLPELKAFILPGGSPLAGYLHLARSICRRAERAVLWHHEEESVSPEARLLLNRLSDWLFTAARTANHSRNVNDIEWRKF